MTLPRNRFRSGPPIQTPLQGRHFFSRTGILPKNENNMKTKKERVDVEVLFPGDKKPTKVETGVQVTLEYDEIFADFNLTDESARKLDEIRAKHLGRYLGEDVKMLRVKLGMSQKDMSLWLGLGGKTISRWENGHSIPSLSMSENLRRIELIEDAITHNILPREYVADSKGYITRRQEKQESAEKEKKVWRDKSDIVFEVRGDQDQRTAASA
jgi:DNA-binding transcriptional regulator YiaG